MAPLTDRFRRVTTSGGYMPEIDGLRFIAIMAVVALHVLGYWTVQAGRTYARETPLDAALVQVVGLGYHGVHLFFEISGFVLALPFCRAAILHGPPVSLRNYCWRRITRLEPPYVISMLVFFAFMPFFKPPPWSALWPHLIASLCYVHEIVYGMGSLINNAAWSLEVEIQFYLLMPLIARGLGIPAPWRRALLAAAAVAFSLHTLWLPAGWPRSILQYAQFFLVGILLCDVWTTAWRTAPRTWLADVPGVASWPLFIWVNTRHAGIAADVADPWIMALLFYSALRGRGHAAILAYGAIPIIGGMCYSVYLLHGRPIAFLVHGIFARLPLTGSLATDYAILLAACVPAVLAASAIFYLAVERPCMDPAWPRTMAAWLAGRSGIGRRAFARDSS